MLGKIKSINPVKAFSIPPHTPLTEVQKKSIFIIVYAVVTLTALEYFGKAEFFSAYFPIAARQHLGLYPQLWWAFCTIILFLALPMAIIKLFYKEKLGDYGWKIRVKPGYLLLYFLMFAAVFPLVWFASKRGDFQMIYPFYRGAYRASFQEIFIWETVYLAQFVALEFFFRGFLVLGLERSMGRLAVWVAVIPYCMIHYHKPPLEAFAAIAAGIILGEIAQRTRTIMGGAMIHMGVALSMDILALSRFR